MNVLILGGTGAIGLPLTEKLAKMGHLVHVTTRKKISNKNNIKYITGNARNFEFIKQLCTKYRYDVIIDFMIYDLDEFDKIYKFMLDVTDQYIFFSSSRVYGNVDKIITENSPRLLDCCNDDTYLSTNEYALRKAREENLLFNSGKQNWTIIRPYITYYKNRLQLGTLEKEHWLRRALMGKTVVFTKNSYSSITSLTYAVDVSEVIAYVVGNAKCYGEVFQVVNNEYTTWKDILEIYEKEFEKITGKKFKYILLDNYEELAAVLNNFYQMKYDRFCNRKFNSQKINIYLERNIPFLSTEAGLSKCLHDFIKNKGEFGEYDWCYEGYVDRITKERYFLKEIPGLKNVIKYLTWKYAPIYILMKYRKHKNFIH